MHADREFYESQAYLDRHNPFDFNLLRVRQFFKDLMGDKNFILSLGCGKGIEDGELLNQGKYVIGLDISNGMLTTARKFFPQVLYIQADAINLPFANNVFDGIVSSHMIEHIKRPEWCIKECHRVLKGGGKCLIICPATTEYYRISPNAIEYKIDRHIWSFSPKKLMEFYNNAGFKNIKNLTGRTAFGDKDKVQDIIIMGIK